MAKVVKGEKLGDKIVPTYGVAVESNELLLPKRKKLQDVIKD